MAFLARTQSRSAGVIIVDSNQNEVLRRKRREKICPLEKKAFCCFAAMPAVLSLSLVFFRHSCLVAKAGSPLLELVCLCCCLANRTENVELKRLACRSQISNSLRGGTIMD